MKRKIIIILVLFMVINIYQITNQTVIIPKTSIRLRVIPNSNNPEDVNIKEKVKVYLENDIYKLTENVTNIEEARTIIKDNISNIKQNITNIFTNNDYQLPYNVNYGYNYFPEKQYQGITYDEGYYESLVISIGEAKGDNWWCVLFPNFCLIDKNDNHIYKSYIKEIIDKYSKRTIRYIKLIR